MDKNLKKLTILHSNDMHGDFLAEEIDENLVGGVSMLSGYVGKVRAEEKNTIYCIAGDMFRGSVIDSEFQGISTIEIMNMLAPDVVTLGNHETDYGIAHLLFIEKCAKFPIINANLHIKTNGARLFKPHHIIEIDGMKILFIGILTQEVLSQTKNDGIIGTFVDIDEATSEIGKICNAYNKIDIDFTVLLTHIGFEEDKKLAAQLDPAWGVDVIVGGHSHTFIEEPAVVNDVVIVQAGTGTDQIGRFDIVVDTDDNCIDSYTWRTVPINNEYCPRDEALEKILRHYKGQTDKKYGRLITRMKKQLTHPSRNQETALGGLLSDIMCESLGLDVMLLGSGSVRSTELGPIVLYSDLCECFPYDDASYMLQVTGAQFKRMIKYMVRDEVWEGVHNEFYQLSSGMRVVYDRATHEFLKFDLKGKPVEDDKIYKIGLQQFHFNNLEDFFNISFDEISENAKPVVVATSCLGIFDEYMSNHQNLDREITGRLVIL
ncbi:MAG: 5'-nucleotidase C-terminal domain-containing protein [Clostridia bacterium]|nr:5'-nucleotidase C-terminal domain-containing protein [Clostridia bacterium]